MDTTFLKTKVRIPSPPHRSVQRERLGDTLERRIPHHKLTLMAAPAGYGKTTLLSQWANSSQWQIVWLSLGDEDNDVERFLRYLAAAWEQVQPDVRESSFGLLLGSQSPEIDRALNAFVNSASEIPNHTVFVLDDYHLITDVAIHEALTYLIDHLPPTVHFVLAGRGEPPLPLAVYRARNQMLELRAEDLQFLPNETADFMNRLMDLDLSEQQIENLQEKLEGWIVGLQLAALTLKRRHSDPDTAVIGGRHRYMADYLNQAVIDSLAPETRQFLLQTSLVDRLCASLCDAVTGRDDSQAVLEDLESQGLFVVALDDSREWYRYHHLFAEFLRESLRREQPAQAAELHLRAAKWYLAHDLPGLSLRHAVECADGELANRIVGRYFPVKLLGGEVRVLARWLDLLPIEWLAAYPGIGLAKAGILLYSGQPDACIDRLAQIEVRSTADGMDADEADSGAYRAEITAMRCFVACFKNDLAQAEILADRALRDLPERDVDLRAGVYGALGDTYRRNAFWQKAQESYLDLLHYTDAPTFRIEAVHVFGALADLALRQGRLRNAAAYWQKALEAIHARENWGAYPLPLIGWVYIRMGELLYEKDDLSGAKEHLSNGLERAELGGDARTLIAGYLLAGRLKLTHGELEAAAEYLEQARQLVESSQFSEWISRYERLQLEVWLAQNQLRTAVEWSDAALQDGAVDQRPESEVAQLALARVLIVKGDADSIQPALSLLDRLLAVADEEGRAGVSIEALALQAIAYWKQWEPESALIALEHSLRLAAPEGYVRTFADLGLPMARLLQEAQSRAILPDYVKRLLDAFGTEVASALPVGQALPEPLTPREQGVLALMSAGLTNREIAEKLIISPGTVKKHTGNIYGKLDVSSRTEAAARARELHLLD